MVLEERGGGGRGGWGWGVGGGLIKVSGHETPRPVRVKTPAGTNGSINRKALSAMPIPLCWNYREKILVCIQCFDSKSCAKLTKWRILPENNRDSPRMDP
ncbi:hypothetical protein AGMMS50267_07720 [Spirochaetia bacterium]|nr:hypothetical protein AGMMS50267_07570 [Spirochaetia bacterium]GHV88412.1 hypothetical protein AGMMS50267_07720 [Spirochaetia bacterium]